MGPGGDRPPVADQPVRPLPALERPAHRWSTDRRIAAPRRSSGDPRAAHRIRPAGVTRGFRLRHPSSPPPEGYFQRRAAYGDFGRTDMGPPRERTERVEALRNDGAPAGRAAAGGGRRSAGGFLQAGAAGGIGAAAEADLHAAAHRGMQGPAAGGAARALLGHRRGAHGGGEPPAAEPAAVARPALEGSAVAMDRLEAAAWAEDPPVPHGTFSVSGARAGIKDSGGRRFPPSAPGLPAACGKKFRKYPPGVRKRCFRIRGGVTSAAGVPRN